MKNGKKQIDATERCGIETRLALGASVRQIAKDFGRELSTITREIRKHAYESFKWFYGRKNQCVHRQDCRSELHPDPKRRLPPDGPDRQKPCCRLLHLLCPETDLV